MVMGSLRQDADVAVIGAGPGGYVAAIRLADLGFDVALVDEREKPGGTCLLEGCIPSKTIINAVGLVTAAENGKQFGVTFSDVKLDPAALKQWTEKVVDDLSHGVSGLLRRRGVELIHGRARFVDSHTLSVEGGAVSTIGFKHAIIATGSRINQLPSAYEQPVWSSAEALTLPRIPPRLLVVGGSYIGLEMGLAYAGLGSAVTIAEFSERLLIGADADLVEVMTRQVSKRLASVLVRSRVVAVQHQNDRFEVRMEIDGKEVTEEFDQVLVAVGRKPNTEDLGLSNTKVIVQKNGIIETDSFCQTGAPHIYAIGDVTDGPMLAHKAGRQARVVAERIAGRPAEFDNNAIPAVVFTDPEIAWTGLTEREAEAQGISVSVGRFPLGALGRARAVGRTDGLVKVLTDPETRLLLGVGMVGPHVSEMIAEATLALEMGATIEDLMVTIHPHPTLSESLMEAAEIAAGEPVHVNPSAARP